MCRTACQQIRTEMWSITEMRAGSPTSNGENQFQFLHEELGLGFSHYLGVIISEAFEVATNRMLGVQCS